MSLSLPVCTPVCSQVLVTIPSPQIAGVPAWGGDKNGLALGPCSHPALSFLTLLLSLVSRLHCESESFKMDLILDVNIQIYPVDLGKPWGC